MEWPPDTSVIFVANPLIISPANMTPIFTTLLAGMAIGTWVLFALTRFGIGNVNLAPEARDSLPAHLLTPSFVPF